jgi:ATP-dependent Clp protease ATP-binding subunit ClpA
MKYTVQTLNERVNTYIALAKKAHEDEDVGIALYNQILVLAADLKKLEAKRAALGDNRVTVERIEEYFTKKTGIDVAKAGGDNAAKYLNMEGTIEKRVAGQSEAVLAISKSVRRAKAGLRPRRSNPPRL